MYRKLSRAVRLALALLCLAAVAAADEVDEYVADAMAEFGIPGLAVLTVEDGRVTRMQGYGVANVEHDVPVTADTIFQSGSLGKQFTAAAVLRLVEQGRLGLDDTLAKHYPQGPSAWHRITIRQLLTHTSGMKDYGDEFDYRRDYTEAELLEVAMQLPLDFEPGTQWSYSNSGYMVLGVLVSELAGEHWSEFLEDEIFGPGGMETARVITEAGIVPHRAAGYEKGPGGELSNQAWVAPSFNTQADGALYFSLRDLAAWERVLRRRELLDADSYAAWWTPVVLEGGDAFPYGFGWNISDQRGRRVIEHGGAWQGFKTYFARYVEDGLTVAVLANVSSVDPGLLAREIAGRVDRDLALPDVGDAGDESAPLVGNLRDVLEAWADWRVSPHMGRALARTRSGSSREAWDRKTVGEHLAAATGFGVVAEDDMSGRDFERRGAVIERIVYCVLEADDSRYRYRFYLSADDKVVDFGEI